MSFDYYAGAIDESCCFETKNVDPVRGLFEGLDERRKSRFGDKGIIFLISEAGSEGCFVEQYAAEHRQNRKVRFKRFSRYKCVPRYFNLPTFHLTVKRDRLDGSEEILELDPPLEYKEDYEKNPRKTLRLVDGIPSLTVEPFYLDGEWERVQANINHDRTDPFPDPNFGRKLHDMIPVLPSQVKRDLPESFRGEPGVRYYCHTDLAKGDASRGHCPAGFAMSHPDGDRVVVDLAARFVAEQGDSINPADVRDLVFYLRNARNFNIVSSTLDQWNAEESVRKYSEEDIFSKIVSVGYAEHEYLKEMMTTGRCDTFYDKEALWELKGLQAIKKDVKPGPGLMMDEADGLAGSVWGAGTQVDKDHKVTKPRVKRGVAVKKPVARSGQHSRPQVPYVGPGGARRPGAGPTGSRWRQ